MPRRAAIWGLLTLAACGAPPEPVTGLVDAALGAAPADAPVAAVDATPPAIDAAAPADDAPAAPADARGVPDAALPDAAAPASSAWAIFRGELHVLDAELYLVDGRVNGIDGRHAYARASCARAPDCPFLMVRIPLDARAGSSLATTRARTVEVIYDVDYRGSVPSFISREGTAVVTVLANETDRVALAVYGSLELQGSVGGWATLDAELDIHDADR
jgi:hypothetical protein